ncbi:MAG: hypothetical protein DMF84_09155 [Acidobacteria bacterium]|nr:MAG: hypothetical protein DMF84_09155 [Acidobacteriota bacterium]
MQPFLVSPDAITHLSVTGEPAVKLTAAEERVLRAALREFEASLENEFHTLREYHPFLRAEDAEVNVGELARKLGLEGGDSD